MKEIYPIITVFAILFLICWVMALLNLIGLKLINKVYGRKEKTNEKEVAMVECPFCNKPIEAPAKADVIFECPHCHKELITYEKEYN